MRFLTAVALAALVLPGCQSTPGLSLAPASANAAGARSAAVRGDVAAWSRSIDGVRPPSVGCFTVSFPSTSWSPIACSKADNTLRRHNVGHGNDYVAEVGPHLISFAKGWFPNVAGVQSVRSGDAGPGSSANSYSLQLNSQFFPTSACGSIAHCAGWVQFAYQNPPGAGSGTLLIWDWLVTTTHQRLSGCPPHAGWGYYGGYCYQVSHRSVYVPNQPISHLGEMSIAGMADADGDSIVFSAGSTKYAVRDAQSDDVTGLSTHWQGAEFNVFAVGDGATATFNAGTTITVGIELRDGSSAAPVCRRNAGTTAESNDLSFIDTASSPASAYPSIRFSESNVAHTGRASCEALAGTRP